MTGFRVPPTSGEGCSNAPVLQSSRWRSRWAGWHPMLAVRPQVNQTNWRCGPTCDIRAFDLTARQRESRHAPTRPTAPVAQHTLRSIACLCTGEVSLDRVGSCRACAVTSAAEALLDLRRRTCMIL